MLPQQFKDYGKVYPGLNAKSKSRIAIIAEGRIVHTVDEGITIKKTDQTCTD